MSRIEIWSFVYVSIGLLLLLQAHFRRIFWTRSRYELVGALVVVGLLWPVLFVVEAIGAFRTWLEERRWRQ